MNPATLPPGSVAVVLGTRPEIIKLAPVIRLIGPAARVIHSGQHYDARLSHVFFDQFGIDEPAEVLGIGGRTRGEQIGSAVAALDGRLRSGGVRAVVVQGDTNTTVAGALAANANDIALVHVEAGLRSFDRAMPEEHNRRLTDHLADICCAPTMTNVDNLHAERIPDERVALTGNTVVEALASLRPDDAVVRRALEAAGVERDQFVLATFHRPENVDTREGLERILGAIEASAVPVYVPLHPRTQERLARFSLEPARSLVRIVDPVDYTTFLALESAAALIVSDSGGLQEEVSVLKRPMIVVRNSTERPETIDVFARLVQPQDDLTRAIKEALVDVPERLRALADVPCPYGDGSASVRIRDLVTELV